MFFSLVSVDPLLHPCPALVLGSFEGEAVTDPLMRRMDDLLEGAVSRLAQQGELTGRISTSIVLHTLGKLPAERLLLVGLGKRKEYNRERLRQAAAQSLQKLRSAGVKEFATLLHMTDEDPVTAAAAVCDGTFLGAYLFDVYKTEQKESTPTGTVSLLCPEEGHQLYEALLSERQAVCGGVVLARDLVSQPGNVATPGYLAEQAESLASAGAIECRVLGRAEMEREEMGGILAVARGSRQEPRLIVLTHGPASDESTPVVLIGKGVTFDSGGISLKPRDGMERMKNDMAGAAAVLGTMKAIAALKLPLRVIALIPAAENLPDGNAYKPGDIVRTMAGKTVEIVNTDAEGRMLLCDALHYAQRFRPRAIVDIATLTGACVVALGSGATGLFGNDSTLKKSLLEAGEKCGERLWELPVWDDYGDLMKSDVADLKNAGGPNAGAITAAWFLQKFVGNCPWAHLDIAGTAWTEKGKGYQPKGATGIGVRLLVEYLQSLAKGA